MKRNILCITIALMVLSLSALLLARPPLFIFDGFYSTLNGSPIHVTLATDGREPLKTIDIQELRDNWAAHEGKFVRFTGIVAIANPAFQAKPLEDVVKDPKVERLILAGDPHVEVYIRDAQRQPETYEQGQTYQFAGFLIKYDEYNPKNKRGYTNLRVYAFDIRKPPETEKENQK